MNYRIADIMKLLKCDEPHANKILEKMEETDIRFSECSTSKFNRYAKEANWQLMYEEWREKENRWSYEDLDYFYDNVLPTLI